MPTPPHPQHQAIFERFLSERRAKHGDLVMTAPTPPAPGPAPTPPPAPAPNPTDPPPNPADPPRTFTQDQLTGIVSRETQQARDAAQRALFQELGVDNLEAAKAAIQAAETARQAQLSDAQKAQEQAQREQQTAQQQQAAAQALIRQSHVEVALARAGIVSDGTDEGNQRVDAIRRMVQLPDGEVTPEVATTAVAGVRTLFPALFTGTPTPPAPPAPPSDPRGKPPAPTPGDSAYERGMQRARAVAGGAGDNGPKITPVGR